jgi:hypothetical protein
MYRCSVCDDLVVCSGCENSYEHDHPFIKIKNVQYKDLKIFITLESEIASLKLPERDQNTRESRREENKKGLMGKVMSFTNNYFGKLFPQVKRSGTNKIEERVSESEYKMSRSLQFCIGDRE